MNSRLLATFAVLLLLGAVVAGYLGYQVSTREGAVSGTRSAEAFVAGAKGTVAVVVAAHDIAAGTALKEEDFYLEYLRQSPPGSYSAIKPVVGVKPWIDIKSGSVLTTTQLQPGGQLARLIRADERAVAIGVDEVVGGGGYVSPGDYVDVLVFIRETDGTNTRESAQVVLPALRVLSYGTRMTRGAEPGKDDKKNNGDEGRSPRTAVLAVPEKFTTRLMLASNAGNLRLAVRSADAGFHERYESGQSAESIVNAEMHNLITLSSLSPRTRSLASTVRRPDREPAVTVYRGKDIQRINE